MKRATISVLCVSSILGLGVACGGEETKTKKEEAKPERDRSNIKRIVSAVPLGKKVMCPDLLPDISKFKELVAEDIGEVSERGKTINATASCAFIKGGEAPTSEAQARKLKKENLKLGVLPGDVYCQVSLYCSLATDEGDFKKKCAESAKREVELGSRTEYEGSTSLGQFACVRKTDRPPSDFAYTFRTIDADTRCILEVMGGPSVVSEELVSNCTRAAIDTITPANLKTFK